MSLVKCKECEKEISSKAKKCPHCGVRRTSRTTKIIAAIFALGFIVSIVDGTKNQNTTNNPAPTNNAPLSVDNNLSTWLSAKQSDKNLLCSLIIKKIKVNITTNDLCSCISTVSTDNNNQSMKISEVASSCAVLLINS